jgi:hypothetical protein
MSLEQAGTLPMACVDAPDRKPQAGRKAVSHSRIERQQIGVGWSCRFRSGSFDELV